MISGLYFYFRIGTIIIFDNILNSMNTATEKTMPICFSPEQLKFIEKYAKSKGMLNASQAIEDILNAN